MRFDSPVDARPPRFWGRQTVYSLTGIKHAIHNIVPEFPKLRMVSSSYHEQLWCVADSIPCGKATLFLKQFISKESFLKHNMFIPRENRHQLCFSHCMTL